jgi:voltage-gated potassium channel
MDAAGGAAPPDPTRGAAMKRRLAEARSRARSNERSELKNTAYEIFIGILSILSIFNLVLVYVFASDPSLQQVLGVMNALFSIIFLGDFLYRLFTAPSAARYFFRGYGWADLFASLPFPQLKVLRVFRLLRVTRLLREVGMRKILRTLVHDRANSALMTLLLMGILVLQFGSLWMLAVEGHAKDANITSASDALWYTVVTISTVGYGDQYPVTNAGRLIGTFIIVVGVGIFGTFTGYLANLFLGPGKSAEKTEEGTTDASASASASAGASPADAPAVGASPTGAATTNALADADAVPGAGEYADPATTARIQALLAQSEEAMAEVRRLIAASPA